MIDYKNFEVGDRIIYKYNYSSLHGVKLNLDGLKGTVKGKKIGDYAIAVEFDVNILETYGFGHDCDNIGKKGHCFWVSPELLIHIDEENQDNDFKIKWYKKGKLIPDDTKLESFRDFYNL